MANDTSASFGTYALNACENKLLSFAQSRKVSWWGRRFALWSRKITLLSSKQPIIDATVEGLKLRLYMNDNVSERKFLFLPQFFDAFERNLMKERLGEGSVFIDVGANAGIYSITAAALVGASGKVISIEPNPLVLERLLYNAKLNGFEDRVKPQQCGVSDAEGSFDLQLDTSNLGGSSLVMDRDGESITVPCKLLKTLVEELGLTQVDGMKIDIEGAEDKALIPFLNSADKSLYPKFLILENSPQEWSEDLPSVLKAKGYQRLDTTRMNQVWEFSPS